MDPLKPFSTSIRLLWERAAKRSTESSAQSSVGKKPEGVAEPKAVNTGATSIQDRLQSRLSALKTWDASRARILFVETVVLDELGAGLETDPAFSGLVQRVSEQLGADAPLCERLDYLLKQTCDQAARR